MATVSLEPAILVIQNGGGEHPRDLFAAAIPAAQYRGGDSLDDLYWILAKAYRSHMSWWDSDVNPGSFASACTKAAERLGYKIVRTKRI